jgi:DNA-binding NarL/FixJ family response regulator
MAERRTPALPGRGMRLVLGLSGHWSAGICCAPEQPGSSGRPWRMLIVEDEWLIGIEFETALLEAGYEVVGLVGTADDAVRHCAEAPPDVVLMDIRLAGERDGVDAALEIRRRFDIPCVFVTAYSDDRTRERGQQAQPLGWIFKPLTGGELVRRIGTIREGSR